MQNEGGGSPKGHSEVLFIHDKSILSKGVNYPGTPTTTRSLPTAEPVSRVQTTPRPHNQVPKDTRTDTSALRARDEEFTLSGGPGHGGAKGAYGTNPREGPVVYHHREGQGPEVVDGPLPFPHPGPEFGPFDRTTLVRNVGQRLLPDVDEGHREPRLDPVLLVQNEEAGDVEEVMLEGRALRNDPERVLRDLLAEDVPMRVVGRLEISIPRGVPPNLEVVHVLAEAEDENVYELLEV